MSVQRLEIGDPFFAISYIDGEDVHPIGDKTIVLNLSHTPLQVRDQQLQFLQSNVLVNTEINNVERAVIVENFASHDDEDDLLQRVKQVWPLAYDVRKEERLKGVAHYMGPKIHIGDLGLGLYHAGSVPLKVGLHKEHPWCPEPGFKEVHTQLVGYGKMQQCREKDVDTLYLEEPMSPGTTHKPMYDEEGNYPWRQYETVTPGIFMAVEILPSAPSN